MTWRDAFMKHKFFPRFTIPVGDTWDRIFKIKGQYAKEAMKRIVF
jgi:hypothetical protein